MSLEKVVGPGLSRPHWTLLNEVIGSHRASVPGGGMFLTVFLKSDDGSTVQQPYMLTKAVVPLWMLWGGKMSC